MRTLFRNDGVDFLRNNKSTATLQRLSSEGGAKEVSSVQIESYSDGYICFTSAVQVQVRTAVTLECNDVMILGEVTACMLDLNEVWRVELKVEHLLNNLQSLLQLRDRLNGEGVPSCSSNLLPWPAIKSN
jgi:hypothetical protein